MSNTELERHAELVKQKKRLAGITVAKGINGEAIVAARHKRYSRVTPEDIERLRQLRREGKSFRQIAKITGRSTASLHTHLGGHARSNKPWQSHGIHRSTHLPPEVIAKIKELRENGMPLRKIAEQTKTALSTAQRVCGGWEQPKSSFGRGERFTEKELRNASVLLHLGYSKNMIARRLKRSGSAIQYLVKKGIIK